MKVEVEVEADLEEVEVEVRVVVEVAEAAGARAQGRPGGCGFWRRAVSSRPCQAAASLLVLSAAGARAVGC